MRIVLVSQRFYPMVGGIETQARTVARELAGRGHTVEVAAVNFAPPAGHDRLRVLHDTLLVRPFAGYDDGPVRVHAVTPSAAERARMLPVAVRAIPRVQRYAYQPLYEFGYRWYRPVFVPKLRALFRRADVVHGLCGGYLGWAAQEAAAGLGVPYVCTPFVHPGQWGDDRRNVAYYRRADAVIGLVPTDAAYLERIGVRPDRLRVIGVSPDLPPTADGPGFRRRHGLGDAPVVLYVGRLMPAKGAPAVLAAAPLVWRQLPSARFVFAGPGTPAEQATFAGTDPRVTYLGTVSHQEKADALAASDLFCMPSMSEILPTVYLEAWSYAKPVVAGRAHGVPELVEGCGGGLAAGQEPGELSAAILKLLGDADRRAQAGEAGRAQVREQYSPAAVCDALEQLYRDVGPRRGEAA